MTDLRPFTRADREQLTRLANAHIAAVMPGWSVPAASLLAHLERQPGEYVVDPWVMERSTLVAAERGRVVAAAHMLRYSDEDGVGDAYRGVGEVGWLLCWPDHRPAGRAVLKACLDQLEQWGVRAIHADGGLPTTVTYGIPDAWPHIAGLLTEAGFRQHGQVELLLAGSLDEVPPPGASPVAGVELERTVGSIGTSFNATLNGEIVGSFEVDDDLARGGSNLRVKGWADECNHWVRADLRGRGIGTWLVAHGASWLRLGGTTRLIVYVMDDEHAPARLRYYRRYGLRDVSRTRRGWTRPSAGRPKAASV